tara:strand:+ start:572 stop:718 length:147 start_codon:yes stop_codon:yes gene_type:complete
MTRAGLQKVQKKMKKKKKKITKNKIKNVYNVNHMFGFDEHVPCFPRSK